MQATDAALVLLLFHSGYWTLPSIVFAAGRFWGMCDSPDRCGSAFFHHFNSPRMIWWNVFCLFVWSILNAFRYFSILKWL